MSFSESTDTGGETEIPGDYTDIIKTGHLVDMKTLIVMGICVIGTGIIFLVMKKKYKYSN